MLLYINKKPLIQQAFLSISDRAIGIVGWAEGELFVTRLLLPLFAGHPASESILNIKRKTENV